MNGYRLAGLGAFGALAGIVLVYLLLVWLTYPNRLGGMTWAMAAVTWISVGTIIAALAAVHVTYGLILLREGRRHGG